MDPKMQYNKNVSQTIIKNLQKRQIEGYYCETSVKAVEKILSLMPEHSTVGWGGSMTILETGLLKSLKERDYVLFDRDLPQTRQEQKEMYAKIFNCDFFLMSTNAITLDGELINIDCRGNRVSFLCYGPENVIIVAGLNKVTADIDSGIKRVKNIASPKNTVRLNKKTPCSVTGMCSDCLSVDCICAQTVVTRFSNIPGRIKVILIGEDLGY